MSDEPFKFLATEAYNRLSQAEQIAYLGRAVATLDMAQRHQLFATPEGDPSPPDLDPEPKPRKP